MKKIIVLVCVMLLFLCGCGEVDISDDGKESESGKIIWEPADENALIENDMFMLLFSKETGEITISNKKTGTVYSSNHGENIEENPMLSDVILTYYDSQSNTHTMNSYENAVQLNSLSAYVSEQGIRLEYVFNEKTADILVPAVLSVEKYEEIKANVSAGDAQKLSMYYELIYATDNTSRVQALKEKYAYLKKNDLYVVFDNLMTAEKKKLSDIITSAGYTVDEYLTDIDNMGISRGEVDIAVSFSVPIEYRLTETGVRLEVCADEIEYAKSLATLQKIDVFSGFGAVTDRAEQFFLADGSGMVVVLSEKSDATFISPIYGNDLSISGNQESNLSQSYRMPICGYSSQGGSWLATVGLGAEAGYVNAEVKGLQNKSDRLFYSFDIEAMDKMSIRPGSNISDVNYYSGKPISVNPVIDYCLYDGRIDETELASAYRGILKSDSGLLKKTSGGNLIYLEFTGYEMIDTTVMGISTQKKVVLSTLGEIQKAVDELHRNGVKGLCVRLTGFGNYGANHAASNTFQLDKEVGSIEELEKLSKSLSDNGGALYLENDVSFAYKNYHFDGFTPKKDAVYSLDGALAYKSEFDLVELEYKNTIDTKYIISAHNYLKYMKQFIKELSKKLDGNIGLSWSAGGKWLFSNFNKKNVLDRTDSLFYTEETLAYMEENCSSVMTGGGNVYVLPFSDCITDVPLYSSSFSAESYDVPLYQYVVHGMLDYTGESITTSLYPDVLKQKSIQTGAAFFYSCVTKEDAYRELEAYKKSGLFAPDIDRFIEEIIEDYQHYGVFYKAKAGSDLKAVTEITDGVYKTEYSNGSFSIVNQSNDEYSDAGITIKGNEVYVSE